MPVQTTTDDGGAAFALTLWTPTLRAAGAALWGLRRVAAPFALVWVVIVFDPPAGPALPVLASVATLLLLCAAQGLLVTAARAEGRVRGGVLSIVARDRVLEVRVDALESLTPWRLPAPVPGSTLRSREGVTLRLGFDDPDPLLTALATKSPSVAAALRHGAIAHARARAQWRLGWVIRSAGLRLTFRYVVWALIPTCAFVFTHQSIAFGGVWGEYRLYGAAAWLRTFVRFWLACVVFSAIYGGLCRALASSACLAATRVAPSHAARARRITEWGDTLLYYAGVPALTALRYLP